MEWGDVMQTNNADKLQSVISDDLFPNVQHISDVKQVIEEMTNKAQSIREPQLKAIILLEQLGENKYLHEKNPYESLIKSILDQYKKGVADPGYYLDTIEALIPKPPKPIVMTDKAMGGRR